VIDPHRKQERRIPRVAALFIQADDDATKLDYAVPMDR